MDLSRIQQRDSLRIQVCAGISSLSPCLRNFTFEQPKYDKANSTNEKICSWRSWQESSSWGGLKGKPTVRAFFRPSRLAGSHTNLMKAETNQPRVRPFWVRVAIWGLSSKHTVALFAWLSAVLGGVSFVFGLNDRRFLVGLFFFVSSCWYFLALRWLDRNEPELGRCRDRLRIEFSE
jgi:hypothetical protein